MKLLIGLILGIGGSLMFFTSIPIDPRFGIATAWLWLAMLYLEKE